LSKANRNAQVNVLETIDGIKIGKRRRRPKRLGLDKGYDSDPLRQELRRRRIVPLAAYRRNRKVDPTKTAGQRAARETLLSSAVEVERSFAWINRFRRLDRFLEVTQKSYRAFVRVLFIKHYLTLMF